MPVHEESFVVRSFEIDAWGGLSMPVLAGYLQEAAGHHADALGCGIDLLMGRGLSWVLVAERIEIAEPIRRGDTVEVATWPAGLERLAFRREFLIRRGSAVAGRATTRWMVLDLATRRAVRPEAAVGPRLVEPAERLLEFSPELLPPQGGSEKRLPICHADIDVNAHVNHTAYLAWMLEAAPDETWRTCRLDSLEVQFLSECRHGGGVISRASADGDGAFRHAIVGAEGGRELARARTEWAKRPERTRT